MAELGPLRFRLVAIPVGKPDLDELVASLLEGSALDVGVIEVPLSVTFEKHSPHGNLRVGGPIARATGLAFDDPGLDANVESEIARRQRISTDADRIRLDRILFDLDHQRTMPQEEVDRLSAEADAIRRRLEARGQQIVDVENLGQSIPRELLDPAVHREVRPTPATIGHTPRSQAPTTRRTP